MTSCNKSVENIVKRDYHFSQGQFFIFSNNINLNLFYFVILRSKRL